MDENDQNKRRIILLRSDIDDIDDEIMELLSERIELAAAIGECKKQAGLPLEDKERENSILTKFKELAEAAEINPEMTSEVFASIIRLTKHHETPRTQ